MKALALLPAFAVLAYGGAAPLPTPLPELDFYAFSDLVGPEMYYPEMEALAEQYRRTGDARSCSPTLRMTPLHLAAMLHRADLVQELLAKGADPNARMLVTHWRRGDEEAMPHLADTPLTIALRNLMQDAKAAPAIHAVVKALLAGGADPNIPGLRDATPLSCCEEGYESLFGFYAKDEAALAPGREQWEAIAMSLIDAGAQPSEDDVRFMLREGWNRAFPHLLQSPQGSYLRGDPLPLSYLAQYFSAHGDADEAAHDARLLDCARALSLTPELLNRPLLPGYDGRDLGGTDSARSALHFCAAALSSTRPDGLIARPLRHPSTAYIDFLALLLERGADARQRGTGQDHSCAADFIACAPQVQAELRRRGFKVQPPPHRFTPAGLMEELESIPTAAVSDGELKLHRELFERCFTDKKKLMEELRWGYNSRAAGRALRLLHRADAQRTRRMLCSLPCWRQAEAYKRQEISMLLSSLYWSEDVILPPAWLAETARFAADIPPPENPLEGVLTSRPLERLCRHEEEARHLVHLLTRDRSPEADAVLNELCSAETPLLLRSAAWSARLAREGLPELCRDELVDWLGRVRLIQEADSLAPEVRTAIRADMAAHVISPTELPLRLSISGGPFAADAASLRALGLPAAAACFDALTSTGDRLRSDEFQKLSQEEQLSQCRQEFAKRRRLLMELELAWAQHLWQHRELFFRLRDSLQENDD